MPPDPMPSPDAALGRCPTCGAIFELVQETCLVHGIPLEPVHDVDGRVLRQRRQARVLMGVGAVAGLMTLLAFWLALGRTPPPIAPAPHDVVVRPEPAREAAPPAAIASDPPAPESQVSAPPPDPASSAPTPPPVRGASARGASVRAAPVRARPPAAPETTEKETAPFAPAGDSLDVKDPFD